MPHLNCFMIKLKGIVKSYNGEPVLHNINLTVQDGDFLTIMGESGSGKSTLLGIAGGFIAPDEGRVLWNGEDISTFSKAKAAKFRCTKLGFVFQSFHLISTLTARENIMLPSLLSERNSQAYMLEICSRLGIAEMLDKFPEQLSGGQQQRVAIARSLTYKPETLILDEPTGALDSSFERDVMELIKEVNSELKTTIIQVTHSAVVAAYSRRVVRIKDGKLCG